MMKRRPCTICASPSRASIELALARRVPLMQIGKLYDVSWHAAARHRKNHMPPQLMAALAATGRPTAIDIEQLKKSESGALLENLVAQRAHLWDLTRQAEDLGDHRAAMAGHGRITDVLRLQANVLGELTSASRITVNTMIASPQWIQIRAALLKALRNHPDAARDVSTALAAIEGAPEQPELRIEAPGGRMYGPRQITIESGHDT